MKHPKQQAEALYTQIKTENPDLWFEVIQYLHWFAVRDTLGYTPAGLDPEMSKKLAELRTHIMLKRDQ